MVVVIVRRDRSYVTRNSCMFIKINNRDCTVNLLISIDTIPLVQVLASLIIIFSALNVPISIDVGFLLQCS